MPFDPFSPGRPPPSFFFFAAMLRQIRCTTACNRCTRDFARRTAYECYPSQRLPHFRFGRFLESDLGEKQRYREATVTKNTNIFASPRTYQRGDRPLCPRLLRRNFSIICPREISLNRLSIV